MKTFAVLRAYVSLQLIRIYISINAAYQWQSFSGSKEPRGCYGEIAKFI